MLVLQNQFFKRLLAGLLAGGSLLLPLSSCRKESNDDSLTLLSLLLATSCTSTADTGSNVNVNGCTSNFKPFTKLSEYRLFTNQNGFLKMNDDVVPYDLNTPLFSDYALKLRSIYIPPGQSAVYKENEALEFPVGTAITKTFLFPADLANPDVNRTLIETRILVRTLSGWETFPYVWNDSQTDATVRYAPKTVSINVIDSSKAYNKTAAYLVPGRNDCIKCHEIADDSGTKFITPIGPKARNLNRTFTYDGETHNQLDYLVSLGKLADAPASDAAPRASNFKNPGSDSLDKRARDYLDINCAHCHNPRASAGTASRLHLNHDNSTSLNLGICKLPGSAGSNGSGGRTYDIVPGKPDDSILMYRMDLEWTSPQAGGMMPLVGRSLAHDPGNQLIRDWITAMAMTSSCN